jgi:hypothetical protein
VRRIAVVARGAAWYSSEVSTDKSATNPAPIALATEWDWELHTRRYWTVVAAYTLIPAALLAPLMQWLGPPELAGVVGLGQYFLILATFIGMGVAWAVSSWADRSGGEYLKRRLCCVSVFAHGVELRDGHGAVLGETANGTLRVSSVNVQRGQHLAGAAQLVHRGGVLTLTPRSAVAPWPGQPAVSQYGRWITVASDLYAQALRFAS